MNARRLHHSILRAAIWALLIAATLSLITPARAAMPSPGDECTDEGASMWGGTSFLTCDGSAWHDALEYEPGGKLLFRLNDDTSECDSTLAGRIRFNAENAIFEGCDGSTWAGLAGGGALDTSECQDSELILFNASTGNAECPFDHLPDAFSFSDEDGAELSTEMESNIVQILNIDDGVEVSVSGDGSPEYRICDDSSCSADPAYTSSAGTIDDGQYIQLRLTSSADHETISTIVLSIGSSEEQWLVTTKSSTPIVADVFSTDLYTETGASLGVINGVDLLGKGGLVWLKNRDASQSHALFDTIRGGSDRISSDTTAGTITASGSITSFNSGGFTLGANPGVNGSDGFDRVAWTFREAPKFFDIVTYTGDGTAGREIAHNLGVVPGMIVVKRTDSSEAWPVYHRGIGATQRLRLNESSSAFTSPAYWNNTEPTESVFSLGPDAEVNRSDGSGTGTYVAYLFAHDEGDDGVIQCGSYIGNGSTSGPTINLGWEPQWVMVKNSSNGSRDWIMLDAARGINNAGGNDNWLHPNTSEKEGVTQDFISTLLTGFQPTIVNGMTNTSGENYVYCAIRAEGA